jgi:flagellar biosynthesis protein FlhG
MNNHKPEIFSISSGKGGVGKTSLAVNLAYALMGKGHRVLLIDGDLGLANIDIMLNLSVTTNIRDIIENDVKPLEAVIYLEEDLGVLPASSGVPEMVNLGPEDQKRLEDVLNSITGNFDYILLDTAAGIGSSVLWFNEFANQNIVVLTPTPTSLTDAYALMKTVSGRYNQRIFHLIINLIRKDQNYHEVFDRLEKAAKQFLGLELKNLGNVPEDNTVNAAVFRQIPFIKHNPKCNASLAVFSIADRIMENSRKQLKQAFAP